MPQAKRVLVAPKIGGKVRFIRMKSGTADFLGLKPQKTLVYKKGSKIPKRGAKGTKSFTLILRSRVKLSSGPRNTVVTLAHPVPGDVTLKMFYEYARGLNGVVGIKTPDGIEYSWGVTDSDLLPHLPGLPPGIQNPFDFGGIEADDLGDLVDFAGDLLSGQSLVGSGLELIGDVID